MSEIYLICMRDQRKNQWSFPSEMWKILLVKTQFTRENSAILKCCHGLFWGKRQIADSQRIFRFWIRESWNSHGFVFTYKSAGHSVINSGGGERGSLWTFCDSQHFFADNVPWGFFFPLVLPFAAVKRIRRRSVNRQFTCRNHALDFISIRPPLYKCSLAHAPGRHGGWGWPATARRVA